MLTAYTPYFVSVAATGAGTGADWSNATTFNNAITAIQAAGNTGPCGGVIYMSLGTHTLTASPAAFAQPCDLSIYGGFAGTETYATSRSATYWNDNPTSIDGQNQYYLFDCQSFTPTNMLFDGVNFQNLTRSSGADGTVLRVAQTNSTGTLTMNRCNLWNNLSKANDASISMRINNAYKGTVVTVTNCNFTSCSAYSAGGVFCFTGPVAQSYTNCTFTSNSVYRNDDWSNGGAIYSDMGDATLAVPFTIANCTFTSNMTPGAAGGTNALGGGAISVRSVNGSITGTTFSGNMAGRYGGAIREDYSSTMVITNTAFLSNYGKTGTGVICVGNSAANSLTIDNCLFDGNYADGNNGGCIWFDCPGRPFTMTNTICRNNTARVGAGGVFYANNGNTTLANCIFDKNWAKTDGGAGYPARGAGTITNCIFTNNTANGNYGGAAMRMFQYNTTVTSCTFINNLAFNGTTYYPGGAIFASSGASNIGAVLDKCYFERNKGGGGGSARGAGAVFVYEDSSPNQYATTMTNCIFYNNFSSDYGGAVYLKNTYKPHYVDSCLFTSNTAMINGGGYKTDVASVVTINNSVFTSNCTYSGWSGAGICLWTPSTPFLVSITSCVVRYNMGYGASSGTGGGAIVLGKCISTLDRLFVDSNISPDAGGLQINDPASTTIITNSIFTNNISRGNGGAIRRTGAGSVLTIINSTFWGNRALSVTPNGGNYADGIYLDASGAASLLNCLFDNHNAAFVGVFGTVKPQLDNCLFGLTGRFNGANAVVFGNLTNPVFDYALLNDPLDGNFTLANNSPAINAGAASASGYSAPLIDYALNPRPVVLFDIGAYESSVISPGPHTPPQMIYRVTTTAGAGTGTTWDTDPADLDYALANVPPNGQIWIATGDYSRATATSVSKQIGIYGGFTANPALDISPESRVTNYGDNYALVNPTSFTGTNKNRIFIFEASLPVTLDGLNFTNAAAQTGDGGAILSDAPLSAVNCKFTSNTCVAGDGGAVCASNLSNSSVYTTCVFERNLAKASGALKTQQASLYVSNSSFTSNTAGYGGAAINNVWTTGNPPATIVISNCAFTSNLITTTGGNGGAIYLNSGANPGPVSITGSTFTLNITTAQSGGAIALSNASSVSIANCAFTSNLAVNGGAIYSGNATTVSIAGCNFLCNRTTTGNGGAFYSDNAAVISSFTNCVFTSNSAPAQYGGAIRADGSKNHTLTNCLFVGNTAANAGAWYNNTAGFVGVVKNCTFIKNAGTTGSGGAFWKQNGSITMDSCVFSNNYAANYGGAMLSQVGTGLITNCQFNDNYTTNNNGGAFRNSTDNCVIIGCSFLRNTSKYGGAVSVDGAAATFQVVDRCWFESNKAVTDGGALYQATDGSSFTVINSVFLRNLGVNSSGVMRREAKTNLRMINCTFVDNLTNTPTSRGIYGDGIILVDGGGPAFFLNCLFDGHECAIYSNPGAAIPQVTNCLFSARGRNNGTNAVICGNIINPVYGQVGDPLFSNPAGNDYTLANDSRAINAGIVAAYGNNAPLVDYALNARPAVGTFVDIGAYESGQITPNPPAKLYEIVRVTTDAVAGDGSTWAAPAPLGWALANVTTGGQIWMKTGDYPMASAFTVVRPIGIYGGFAGVDGVDVTTASRIANYGANYAQVNPTTITASGADRAFVAVPMAFQFSLDGLNFINGYALEAGGGAIQSYTNTNISQCLFTSNTAKTIYFRNGGGAVLIANSVANIADTRFTGNYIHPGATAGSGGALLTSQTMLTMDRCVIDGNVGRDNGGGFFLDSTGGATINNSSFTSNVVTVLNGGAIRVYGGVAVTLNGCTFSTNTVPSGAGSGGAIYSENNGGLNATQCALYGNSAQYGGAIRVVTNVPCNLTSCALTANTAAADGGAVYDNSTAGCAFNFTGCTFSKNTAGGTAGAFKHGVNTVNSLVTLNGCVFDGNRANGGQGGAYYVGYLAGNTATNCVFNNNYAAGPGYGGGAVATWKDGWTFNSCIFTSNSTPTTGGAVYFATNASGTYNVTFNNCIFRYNSAGNGGALGHGNYDPTAVAVRYNATLNGCEFTGNKATVHGGAIVTFCSDLTIASGTLVGNTSTMDGGAISVAAMYGTTNIYVKVDRAFLDSNSARNGGAIVIQDGTANSTCTNCVITRNQASGQGGAIRRNTTARLGVVNCTIADNIAAGALYSGHYTDGIYVGLGSNPNTVIANCLFDGQDLAFGGTAATTVTGCLFGPNGRNEFTNFVADAVPYSCVAGNPDPGFINDAAGNFDLVSTSPAINAGATVATLRNVLIPTVDILNLTRYLNPDIGAFEAAPGVTTISLVDRNPPLANVKTFTYVARFNQPVTGVDATDFRLTGTGTIYGAQITNFAALSTTDYIVTATIQGGAGLLRLDQIDDGSISSPNTGVRLNHGNRFNFIGQSYLVDYDSASVVITAITLAGVNPTSAAAPLVYQVSFSQPVQNIDVNDFQLTLGGAYTTQTVAPAITGVSASAVSTSVLVTVNPGVCQGDMRLDALGASDIQDQTHGYSLANIPYTAGDSYTFDDFAPVILTYSPRALVTSDTSIIYDLIFHEPVTTPTADLFNLILGPQITTAAITDISDVSAGARTAWAITIGNIVTVAPAGGVLQLDLVSTNILDNLGNALAATQTGASVIADLTAPSLLSIVAQGANPTSATSIVFDVTFSEAITGLTQGALMLTVPGVGATGVISGLSGSGAAYQVTVDTIVATAQAGAQLKLDLADLAGIVDQAGFALDAPSVSGLVRADQVAPNFDPLAAVAPTSGSVVDKITVTTVTFNEPVAGVTAADLTLTTDGVTIATPLSVSNPLGDGITYVFAIDDNFGSGPVQIILTLSGAISDLAGNPFGGQQWSIVKDVTVIPVSLASAQVADGGITSLTAIVMNAHFTAAVTGFDPIAEPDDVTTVNCTVIGFTVLSTQDYLITIAPVTQGLVSLRIPTNVCNNPAIPSRVNASSNLYSFTVDSILPTFASFTAAPTRVKVGTTVTLSCMASEPLSANATMAVNGNAATLLTAADPFYSFRYLVQAADPEGSATLTASGYDAASNLGTTADGIVLYVDKTAPTAVISIGSPDAGAVVTIQFSEEVTGVDIGDFVLTRNGIQVFELSAFTKISSTLYTVVVGNTTPGPYALRLVAATSGVQDLAGIPMAVDAVGTWQVAPAASTVEMWSRY